MTQRRFPVRRTVRRMAMMLAGFAISAGVIADPSPHPTARFLVAHPDLTTTRLDSMATIEATIRGAAVDRYTVNLERGQFAAVRLRQTGGNLVATAFAPDGRLLRIVDETAQGQSEIIPLTADSAGTYAIQVAVFEWDTPEADYAIELTRRERAGRTPREIAEQWISAWHDPEGPGAAILVLKHGRPIYQRAIGLSDVERGTAMTLDTPVDLASVSKQFTGYAVAMLIARGRLRLDDPARRYLPELGEPFSAVTVRHLLEHTSGVRDWDRSFALTGRAIEDGIGMDEVLAMSARQRVLNFAPGTRQQYSNAGYVLLALIVERVGGQPFDIWMTKNIFRPLGMTHCRLARANSADDGANTPSYATRWPTPRVFSARRMVTLGSSALECSANDLAIWLDNYRHGKLGGDAVQKLVTQTRTAPNSPGADYVFGNWRSAREGHSYRGHEGLAAGFRTSMRHYLDDDLSVIYLANDGNDATHARVMALEDLFLGVPARPVEVPEGEYEPPLPQTVHVNIADYVGDYHSDELATTYSLRVRDSDLYLRNERGREVMLRPAEPDVFVSSERFLEMILFVRDKSGAVVGLRLPSASEGDLDFSRTAADVTP